MEAKLDNNFLVDLKMNVTSDHFLVIDIGSFSTKIMEVKRKKKLYSIEKTWSINEMAKFYKNKTIVSPNGIVEKIMEVIRFENIKAKKIYLVFSTHKLQNKIVTLPKVEAKEIKSFVDLELQKQFPDANKLTDIIDYMPLGEFIKDSTVHTMTLISVIPNIESETIVKEFSKHKLSVTVIDVDLHLMGNISRLNHIKEMQKVNEGISIQDTNQDEDSNGIIALDTAIFEIGNETSNIVFTHNGVPIFTRSLTFGMSTIIKSIQNVLEVSIKDAEWFLEEKGLKTEKDISRGEERIDARFYNEVVESNMGNSLNEVFRSLQYVSSNFNVNIDKIIIVGGGARYEDIDTITTNVLEVPTERWTIAQGESIQLDNGTSFVNNTDAEISGEFALCYGLMLRGNIE